MKGKGAAGLYDPPPTFLKALGLIAIQELLEIFNASFMYADCPRIWRVGIMIPILKTDIEVASYQPIGLTPCIVKLHEHILADHLYYIAESDHLFSCFQAGFQKRHSWEDQILKIVQAIEDGFQENQCKALYWLSSTSAKLTTLFGGKSCSYTYSSWLLQLPSFTGFAPSQTIEEPEFSFSMFLSSSRRFWAGLPQGSVLAPLLFLF